ncbi:hypothetical protein [uncultured Treponema sp.]|uniref:hypothetical protein n=1 Tax=uncultured Treponema sp. TaxID=162155 RepID=UPI00259A1064|nr:hypothetical protein [uncultured Treponema sp.]
MIEWIKEKFAAVIKICFILYVIAVSISFGKFGTAIGDEWQHPVLGFMLGLAIGIVLGIFIGILFFGFLTTIIDISRSNDYIAKKLDDISSKLEKTNTSSSQNNDSHSNNNDVWICKKCNATNPVGTKFCKNCGN